MAKLRVSLLTSTLVLAPLAVAFAAIKSGSSSWFRGVYSLAVVTLAVASLASRRPGKSGAFSFGFAVFGWSYFLVALGPNYPHILPAYNFGPEETFAYPNPNLMTSPWVDAIIVRAMGM